MNVLRISSAVTAFVCGALLCLLAPAAVQASEKTGVYMTPKFTANFMSWQVQGDSSADSITDVQNKKMARQGCAAWDYNSGKNATLWGGALAIGYDFYPRFDLPLRVELEYGMYSNTQGSTEDTVSPQLIDRILGVPGLGESAKSGRKAWVDTELKLRNIQTLLLNAYWDFHNSTNFTPYIGAGLGLAFIQAQGSSTVYLDTGAGSGHQALYEKGLGMRNATNFAWQVGLGCSYAFTDNIALDLGYRFMGLGSVESNSISVADRNYFTQGGNGLCDINMHGRGEARDIYMHQIALGLRISF